MAAPTLRMEVKGVAELVDKCEAGGKRILAKPLKKAFRAAGKVVKAHVVTIARPVGRSLTRKIKVSIDRGMAPAYVPTYAKVKNSAAWINVAEVGRHPGAKMPPVGTLKGGYAAAKAVSIRGLPGHHVMERAEQASRAGVQATFAAAASEMEQAWRG